MANKVNKTVCLPPETVARVEAVRQSMARPLPSFSKVLHMVLQEGLNAIERKRN